MKMRNDFIRFCTTVFVTSAAIVALVLIGGNEYLRYQCANYERIAMKETRYANFDVCYVKTAQGFQRWDEYKIRAAASEGLADK